MPARRRLTVLFVVDGLRPDMVTPAMTPTIAGLRSDGVTFTRAHAVPPSVTRVNCAAMATGVASRVHGITGNQILVAGSGRGWLLNTGDAGDLLRLRERAGYILGAPSLGDRLSDADKTLATVGTGSSGCSLLLNTAALEGRGVMVSTSGVPAAPATARDALLRTCGPPPGDGPCEEIRSGRLAYASDVVATYVLPQVRPDVLIVWLTEPDHSQHLTGLGSPQSIAAIAAADSCIAAMLDAMERQSWIDELDVLIVSDHGFTTVSEMIDVEQDLVDTGLKEAPGSPDVVVVDAGCPVIHVSGSRPEHIRRIVDFLQRQPWTGAVFTPPPRGGRDAARPAGELLRDPLGWVPGTFSTEFFGYGERGRAGDVVFAFAADTAPNAFGVPGRAPTLRRRTVPPKVAHHGGMSPADIRSTLVASGPAFAKGVADSCPVGNLDIAPTLLELAGCDGSALDGRVLREAFADAAVPAAVEMTMIETDAGNGFSAALDVASCQGRLYVTMASGSGLGGKPWAGAPDAN